MTFTALDTVEYHVGVQYTYAASTPGRESSEGTGEPEFCARVRSRTGIINGDGYQGAWYQHEGRTLVVRSFPGQAHSTYTITLTPTKGSELLKGRTPRLKVEYDRRVYHHALIYEAIATCAWGFWSLVGLLLTFLGRKR